MQFGYFDDERKEYVITSPKTPLPWINYLGSEDFFSLVSNTCGGYSFYVLPDTVTTMYLMIAMVTTTISRTAILSGIRVGCLARRSLTAIAAVTVLDIPFLNLVRTE